MLAKDNHQFYKFVLQKSEWNLRKKYIESFSIIHIHSSNIFKHQIIMNHLITDSYDSDLPGEITAAHSGVH
jgi:hypothetical protein